MKTKLKRKVIFIVLVVAVMTVLYLARDVTPPIQQVTVPVTNNAL